MILYLMFIIMRVQLFNKKMTVFFFLFPHTTCESMCDTLASSAANQGDNTVSVAQGGTATPGTIEQLLPLDRVFKRNLCISMYIYVYTRSTKSGTLHWTFVHLEFGAVCDLKMRLLTAVRCHRNRFLILHNYTRKVIPRV